MNFFPPIAFLFRREIYDSLNGYDERYPVLGDWDFNLRFLLEANIGVLHESLANYHHRDRGDPKLFGNSVIAESAKHAEFAPIVRNNLIRQLNERGSAHLAVLIGLGAHWGEGRKTLRGLNGQEAGTTGRGDPNTAWVALQRLERGISTLDVAFLKKAGAAPQNAAVRALLRVLSRFSKKSRKSDKRIRKSISKLSSTGLAFLASHDAGSYRKLLAPPYFDESGYLMRYPDVAVAVKSGTHASGFEHYYYFGREEGRTC